MKSNIPKPILSRLPSYLDYLYRKKEMGLASISSSVVAEELNLNPVMVRKDLAATGTIGRPKTGFDIDELIRNIIDTLGYDHCNEAILIGAGHLGRALLSYKGFASYGLNIAAAFDIDESVCNSEMNGTPVYHLNQLQEKMRSLNAQIGIITVPDQSAQQACDLLIENGILAIWNFAPVHLKVPENILVQNENMAASLAILSQHLKERM